MRKFIITSIIYFVVSAGSVFGDTPEPIESIATMPGAGDYDMVLFVLPDGTGSSFNNAQILNEGTLIDAHIELLVRDMYLTPIANYPKEDLWLESADDGMVPCSGGTCADADTDQNGFTTWETPLHAGGHSESQIIVYISGMALPQAPFHMAIVSADINGDGAVNLADVGSFSSSFFNEYTFEADLFSDGVLNLADVGRLALGSGRSCP